MVVIYSNIFCERYKKSGCLGGPTAKKKEERRLFIFILLLNRLHKQTENHFRILEKEAKWQED